MNTILDSFDTFAAEAKTFPNAVDWSAKQREQSRLVQQGLPTRKHESWRNTSLKFLSEYEFKPVTHAPAKLDESVLSLLAARMIDSAYVAVFVNGFYMPALSRIDSACIQISERSHVTKPFNGNSDSAQIHSLNEIYTMNPVEISIVSDLTQPLQILNVTHLMSGDSAVVSSPNVSITLKTNKEAKIILSHTGEDRARYFSNGHYTFMVEKDARLELINHTNQSQHAYHFDFVGIMAEAASTVRYFELNFNALLTRHEFVLELNGEHIQSEILGASYLRNSQHCDSQTFINHHKGSCQSEQTYKSLLDDESRSVFSGTVFIADGIAKADSAQLNQNVLLSDKAEVNSKPILRIFSDDVKASHGSTMGQVSEDEIFYLQSRSISRAKAIELLGQGFLNAIILRIGNENVRRYFSKELLRELGSHKKTQLKVIK